MEISPYEREKIESTVREVELLAETMKAYLGLADYCARHGIEMSGRSSLESIRYPTAPAGPDSDLKKLLEMFQKGQTQIAKNMTKEQVAESQTSGGVW